MSIAAMSGTRQRAAELNILATALGITYSAGAHLTAMANLIINEAVESYSIIQLGQEHLSGKRETIDIYYASGHVLYTRKCACAVKICCPSTIPQLLSTIPLSK